MKHKVNIRNFWVGIIVFMAIPFFSQTYAQGHNVKCQSCKYWQRPAGAKNVVKIECVCEPCREKDKKEQEAKQAEDKRRQEVIVAENQRKAKEEAERIKREQEQNKPTNVVISAPKTSGNSTTKTKVETNSDDLKEWKTFEDKNSRPTKVGFGYYDSEKQTNVITIPAKFGYQSFYRYFQKNSKYTSIRTTRNSDNTPCHDNNSSYSFEIINRKGETVISKNNTGYLVLQPTPFAIEFSYLGEKWGGDFYGCSAQIFNIETNEIISKLNPNYIMNQYGVTSKVWISNKYIFKSDQKEFIIEIGNRSYYPSEDFTANLKREFSTGKYTIFIMYPNNSDMAYSYVNNNKWVGYFFSQDGRYKVVTDEWLTNILGKIKY